MDIFVVMNFITLILAIVVCIYSFKLVLCLNHGIPSNWWGVMPIAFLWATCNRALVLMESLGYLTPDFEWLEWISASQIVFWGLILIFKVGFYRELEKVLCPVKDKCEK